MPFPMEVDGGSANDTFNVAATASTLTLNGNAGNDTFNIAAGNLDSIAGKVTVNGAPARTIVCCSTIAATHWWSIIWSTPRR